MTDITRQLRTLDDGELERLYYQAGMVEVAAVYARAADLAAENDEYQEEVSKMYPAADYDKIDALNWSSLKLMAVSTAFARRNGVSPVDVCESVGIDPKEYEFLKEGTDV